MYAVYERVASRTGGLGDRLGEIVTASFLYRWLTKEPEPEVIVIDLRETRTVGPLIGVLDRTIEWIQPYWQGSRLKQGVDGSIALLERAAQTRIGQSLAAVLTPPEPPARTTEESQPASEDVDAERAGADGADGADDPAGASDGDEDPETGN